MSTVEVNRGAYLVFFTKKPTSGPDPKEGETRTYACEDMRSLQHLFKKLTGRDWSTFVLDDAGVPNRIDNAEMRLTVAHPFHIYGSV